MQLREMRYAAIVGTEVTVKVNSATEAKAAIKELMKAPRIRYRVEDAAEPGRAAERAHLSLDRALATPHVGGRRVGAHKGEPDLPGSRGGACLVGVRVSPSQPVVHVCTDHLDPQPPAQMRENAEQAHGVRPPRHRDEHAVARLEHPVPGNRASDRRENRRERALHSSADSGTLDRP